MSRSHSLSRPTERTASVERGIDITTVRMRGELDALVDNDVTAAIGDALVEPAARILELDLRDVTFMDSYGLYAAIIRTSAMTDKAGISLRVVVNPAVRTVLEQAGVDHHLEIVQRDEA